MSYPNCPFIGILIPIRKFGRGVVSRLKRTRRSLGCSRHELLLLRSRPSISPSFTSIRTTRGIWFLGRAECRRICLDILFRSRNETAYIRRAGSGTITFFQGATGSKIAKLIRLIRYYRFQLRLTSTIKPRPSYLGGSSDSSSVIRMLSVRHCTSAPKSTLTHETLRSGMTARQYVSD